MFDHLVHLLQAPSPHKRTRLGLGTARKNQGALTPPIAQSPVSRLSGHDLVAISMGMGGWVFKINLSGPSMMLEPKWSDRKSMQLRLHNCVCVNMRIQSGNINISQANDLFTPKPAKHDKHIHWAKG